MKVNKTKLIKYGMITPMTVFSILLTVISIIELINGKIN